MTVRSYLSGYIKPAVTSLGWAFHDHDKSLGTVGKVTALLVHTRVEPAEHQGHLRHTVSLVVVDSSTVEKNIDNRLDEHLEDLIPVLQTIPNVQFIDAEKGTREEYPAYVITLTIQTAP